MKSQKKRKKNLSTPLILLPSKHPQPSSRIVITETGLSHITSIIKEKTKKILERKETILNRKKTEQIEKQREREYMEQTKLKKKKEKNAFLSVLQSLKQRKKKNRTKSIILQDNTVVFSASETSLKRVYSSDQIKRKNFFKRTLGKLTCMTKRQNFLDDILSGKNSGKKGKKNIEEKIEKLNFGVIEQKRRERLSFLHKSREKKIEKLGIFFKKKADEKIKEKSDMSDLRRITQSLRKERSRIFENEEPRKIKEDFEGWKLYKRKYEKIHLRVNLDKKGSFVPGRIFSERGGSLGGFEVSLGTFGGRKTWGSWSREKGSFI